MCCIWYQLVTLHEKILELKEKQASLEEEMRKKETPVEERERLLKQVWHDEIFYHFPVNALT